MHPLLTYPMKFYANFEIEMLHHLKVLITADLINVDKRGKGGYYSVNRGSISKVNELLNDIFDAEGKNHGIIV